MRLRLFLAAMALCSVGAAAHADTFNFSFGSASSTFSGSGVLTGSLEAPQEYLITSVTGAVRATANGPALTIESILAPGTFPLEANGGEFPPNDNTLFVINGAGNFSQDGLSFLLTDGEQINLYDDGPGDDALLERANGTDVFEDAPIVISTAATTAATPEPSSFALLGTGLVGAASALQFRRKQPAA